MLVRVKKIVLFGALALAATAISLPVVSGAATSPSVTVLSPLVNGLRAPVKIALDADGNIYVADQRIRGVVKYNAYGEQLVVIRTATPPAGLAIAQDGSLLVSQGEAVVRYNVASGLETSRFTEGKLQSAASIAVDDVTGYVYVVDSRTSQVVSFTASGAFDKFIGSGQLTTPTGITFDKVSRLLVVADTYGNKVQFFDLNGAFVKSVGDVIPGGKTAIYGGAIAPLMFTSPVAVAFEYNLDSSAAVRMYIVDSYQGLVKVVDPANLGFLSYIGTSGTANGQLMVPSDAVYDAVNKRLLVVNGFGNITIYGIDGGSNPVAVAPPVPPVVIPPVVIPAPAFVFDAVSSITKSSVITISGTVDAGSTVSVVNLSSSKSGEAVVTGGAWKYDVTLVEGVNNLSVSAQKANSEKAVASASITLDTVLPALTVSALANGSYTSTQVQNISGTVSDSSGAALTVNGVVVPVSGNAYSTAVTLNNGANQISVVAVDAVGNTSVISRTITFDAAKPVIAVAAPVDNSFTTSSVVTLSGSVDKSATVKVAGVAATVEADNSWSAAVTLQAGENTVEIVATDLAGNSSSAKRTITVDTSSPSLAVVSPAQDVAVKVPNVLISGTVSDTTATLVEYAVNGTTVPVAANAGVFSFNVDFAAEGKYPVVITATDAAGNKSTVTRNVIYDKTPPVFTLNKANGVAPEKLNGTVEDGSTVVVKDNSTLNVVAVTSNGSWSANLAGVTYDSATLLAVATDAAGNSTSQTLAYSFPDGTLSGTGKPTVQDALKAIRMVVNKTTPSAAELAHYDIGPLVGGKPNPDGKIEIVDAILILRKALGLTSW
jgi:hypothetical protein